MFFFIGITMALVQGMQNRTHKILYVTVILNGYKCNTYYIVSCIKH